MNYRLQVFVACFFVLLSSMSMATEQEDALIVRVRRGDKAALKVLLKESYYQEKDVYKSFYYLAIYNKATGMSFFENDARAFEDMGGLFDNAVKSVCLLDEKIVRLDSERKGLLEERGVLNQKIAEYMEKLNKQEEKNALQNLEYEELLNAKCKLSEQLVAFEKMLQAKNSEIEKLSQQLAKSVVNELKATVQQLENEKQHLCDQIGVATHKIEELQSKLERITLEQRDTASGKADLQKEVAKCQKEIQGLTAKVRVLEGDRAVLMRELASSVERIAQFEEKEDVYNQKEKRLNEGLASQGKQMVSLRKENAELRAELKKKSRVEEDAQHTQRLLDEREQVLEDTIADLKKAEKTIKVLTKRYSELEGRYINKGRTKPQENTSAIAGVSRGMLTCVMAPLNYLRSGEYAYQLALADPYSDPEDSVSIYGNAAILLAPAIVVETVPCALDVVNGLLDCVTFGYYGDWLYGNENTPWWWKRSNKTFPGINKY